MSSKILVVGDIHVKPYMLRVAKEVADKHQVDKILLMGDYVDDWDDGPVSTLGMLTELDEFMKDSRVTALIGNHELSYLEDQRCSGWTLAKKVMFDASFDRRKFALSHQEGNWLFTHAGLTDRWYKYANRLNITPGSSQDPTYIQHEKEETVSDWLNRYWDIYPGIYKSIGKERGGFGIGSPLWADQAELIAHNYKGLNQVVGHTPQEQIEWMSLNGDQIVFVDVWSNGGKGGFLLWEDGELTSLDSTGTPVVNPAIGG